MHANAMNSAPTHPRSLLACLGDASRFELVCCLIESERCVSELAVRVGLSQSCTTRHLQALQRQGLVRGAREGKRVVFRLRREEPSVGALLEWALREAEAGRSGPGGANLHRETSPAPARPPAGGSRPNGKTKAPAKSPAEPRPGAVSRPEVVSPGSTESQEADPPVALRRPEQLEDYLL